MGQARARLRAGDLGPGEFPTIGAYFSAVREASGQSIEEIASRTHIKAAYLNAIELMQIDDLPSRPFALGFVKTYADALGVDASAAVAKFKENIGAAASVEERVVSPAPSIHPVEERERPLASLISVVLVLGFILFCAIMIAQRAQVSAPYTLEETAIPGALRAAPAEAPAAGAPAQSLPVTVEPLLVEAVDPVYPRRCETDAAATETVEIAFNVTAAGLVSGERVASTTNPCFNEAALNTARLWRFSPQTVNAQPRMAYDQRHVFEFKRP